MKSKSIFWAMGLAVSKPVYTFMGLANRNLRDPHKNLIAVWKPRDPDVSLINTSLLILSLNRRGNKASRQEYIKGLIIFAAQKKSGAGNGRILFY